MVLDLGLPDMTGLELIEKHQERPGDCATCRSSSTPGRDLTPDEQERLEALAESIITKDARSMERLLDETALFLHRVEENLAPGGQGCGPADGQPADAVLAGRKVLVVDDDVRNIFAMTSMLERWEMKVLRAENGREALEILEKTPDIDVVLMDIMMPEMDGYETMRAIRERCRVPRPADHRPDGQGDEGRPPEVPRRRRVRLHRQAGAGRAARLASSASCSTRAPSGAVARMTPGAGHRRPRP